MEERPYQRVVLGDEAIAPEQRVMNRGRFFDETVETNLHGKWSDGICSCFSDLSISLVMCAFPPFLIFQIMRWLPRNLRSEVGPCGIGHPIAAMVFFILAQMVNVIAQYLIGWIFEAKGLVIATIFDYAFSVIFAGFNLTILYTVMKISGSVTEMYSIRESGLCCKSLFCPMLVLARVARHVSRARGYTEYYD